MISWLNVHILVRDWKVLIEYTTDKQNFDQAFFNMIHNDYAKKYQRCSDDEQGEICHLINEWVKS